MPPCETASFICLFLRVCAFGLCRRFFLCENKQFARYIVEYDHNNGNYQLGKIFIHIEHAAEERIARKRGMLISGGEANTERAAIMLLDEFRSGAMGRITLERIPQ